jgi:hypothetical protein
VLLLANLASQGIELIAYALYMLTKCVDLLDELRVREISGLVTVNFLADLNEDKVFLAHLVLHLRYQDIVRVLIDHGLEMLNSFASNEVTALALLLQREILSHVTEQYLHLRGLRDWGTYK